ncbi:MAG: Hsp20/alpha crystallin family protein [Nakamurella sp.]
MALTLLTRRDPFVDFDTMIRHAFPAAPNQRAASRSRGEGDGSAFAPAADVVRDGDDAVISLDAPGVNFDRDITVELDRTTLVISGERRNERADKSTGDTRSGTLQEVRYGTFRRAFTLPEHVTAESLTATYDAGVLAVRVAGAFVSTQPQKITVTAGTPSVVTDAVTDSGAAGIVDEDVQI